MNILAFTTNQSSLILKDILGPGVILWGIVAYATTGDTTVELRTNNRLQKIAKVTAGLNTLLFPIPFSHVIGPNVTLSVTLSGTGHGSVLYSYGHEGEGLSLI